MTETMTKLDPRLEADLWDLSCYIYEHPELGHEEFQSAEAHCQLLEKYGFTADQLLVVDDMKPAWDMASKVNVPVAFAKWGKLAYPQICQEMDRLCDYTFDSPQALKDFLFRV